MRERPARLTFLYSSELDGALHASGPESRATSAVLDALSDRVDRARSLLARDGSTVRTVLVGDHGMAAIHRTISARDALDGARVRHFIDSTMLRMWGAPEELARVRLAAERARWPTRYIDARGLAEWGVGVDQSPWGDAWLVLDEGYLFAPSHVGGFVRGMHGYGPDAGSSRACLCSDLPVDSSLSALSDVAPWVRSLMGEWA